MRFIKALVILLFLLNMPLEGQKMISQANRYLANQEYDQAIGAYLSILNEGKHSKEVYESLGYSYFNKSDLANAILYYEKASKLAPKDVKINEALAHIRSELPIQITLIPDFILLRYYRNIANIFSSKTWSILQLLLAIALVYLIYRRLFVEESQEKNLRRNVNLGLLIIGIFATATLSYHKRDYEIGGFEGVSQSEQILYQSPDERSEVVVSIGPGNKVLILDSIGDWYKVQLADKDIGWLRKARISLI